MRYLTAFIMLLVLSNSSCSRSDDGATARPNSPVAPSDSRSPMGGSRDATKPPNTAPGDRSGEDGSAASTNAPPSGAAIPNWFCVGDRTFRFVIPLFSPGEPTNDMRSVAIREMGGTSNVFNLLVYGKTEKDTMFIDIPPQYWQNVTATLPSRQLYKLTGLTNQFVAVALPSGSRIEVSSLGLHPKLVEALTQCLDRTPPVMSNRILRVDLPVSIEVVEHGWQEAARIEVFPVFSVLDAQSGRTILKKSLQSRRLSQLALYGSIVSDIAECIGTNATDLRFDAGR